MELISAVFLAVFIALTVLGGWHELRHAARIRAAGLEKPHHRRRLRRRLLGLLLLSLAVAVLAFTSEFEARFPDPVQQAAWIGMAFVFVFLAVWQALRDLGETGRIAQDEAQHVVLDSLVSLQEEIERAKRDKSKIVADQPPRKPQSDHDRSRSKSRRGRLSR